MKKILWSKNHRYIVEIFDTLSATYCIVHFVGDDKPYRTTTVTPNSHNYSKTFSQAVREYQTTHAELIAEYDNRK